MSIDRRLRSASNALREVDLAVPHRVPKGSMTRTPTMALPVLMLVFGAALAMTGLDRTPGSEPVPESAAIVVEAATIDRASPAAASGGDAYDIDHELQLIRELRRRPVAAGTASSEPISVAAPDANDELELIRALVERPAGSASVDGARTEPAPSAPSAPIVGLS